jgi:hypothetical protein
MAGLLPYLYNCIPFYWDYADSSPLAYWVGIPIAFYTIPTISFLYDIYMQQYHPSEIWLVRLVFEIVIIVPLWVIAWVCFEWFVLGWVWITF